MKNNKWLTIVFFAFTCVIIVLCVLAYNTAVSNTIFETSENDKKLLSMRNTELVAAFCDAKNAADWQKIVDGYQDIIISVKDPYGNKLAATADKRWSLFDVKAKNSFVYGNMRYTVRSSVYFERNYFTDTIYVGRIMVIFIASVLMLMLLVAAIIYSIMLHPYRKLYQCIEDFDSDSAVFEKIKSKGYTAKVYNRFCDLRERVVRERANQVRIIASISHDIKTPLTSVMGYSEQLKKGNLTEERKRRYLDTIYDKSIEIKNIVNDFDEYLGYVMHPQLCTEPYATDEMMQFVDNDYACEFEEKGVRLILINEARGRYVDIEKQKIMRVADNIFSNSLKHMDKEEKIVKLVLSYRDGRILFRFSDNGCGVEKDKLELIFEPLYTSDEGRQVAGLGLAICREIMESMGGKIWAEPSEYGGLSICGYFPEAKEVL